MKSKETIQQHNGVSTLPKEYKQTESDIKSRKNRNGQAITGPLAF